MNSDAFVKIVDAARARQDGILKTKGADYARHEEDRLSNFKRSAAAVELDPLVVWAVFFNKHIDAIMAYIKTGKTESEAIEGRIDDASNYLYLLEALIAERNIYRSVEVEEKDQDPYETFERDSELQCMARNNDSGRQYVCTRRRGHPGKHHAHYGPGSPCKAISSSKRVVWS